MSLLSLRLSRHHLTGPRLPSPESVVDWFGAVQSQDPAGARWAVAQRLETSSDAAVREALNAGTIVRTHVLRPTWHYVMPGDLRWMLELTAPRIKKAAGAYYRQAGLTPKVFAACHDVVARALEGGRHRTRRELGAVLQEAGHALDGQAVGHVLMQAELDALVCSGTSQGAHATYALLDEWIKPVPTRSRDEALAALATRYFRSHGPALVEDFVWWSGLTVRDAKAGMARIASTLRQRLVDGREYWDIGEAPPRAKAAAHLLPNFDEYTVAYRDRQLLWASPQPSMASLSNVVAINGQLVGFWTRTVAGSRVTIDVTPERELNASEWRLIGREAKRYVEALDADFELRLFERGRLRRG